MQNKESATGGARLKMYGRKKAAQVRQNVVSAGPCSPTGFVKKIEVLKYERGYLEDH